jgi:hypothetical protein
MQPMTIITCHRQLQPLASSLLFSQLLYQLQHLEAQE